MGGGYEGGHRELDRARCVQSRVTAVLVHHSNVADTFACLEQLERCGLFGSSVIVIGNGAPSEDLDTLRAHRASDPTDTGAAIRVLDLARNRGFAAGANAGIEAALHDGADAVLLINPDVTFSPDLVERLVEQPGAANEVRMPEIAHAGEPDRTWFAGAWNGRIPGRMRRRRTGDPRRQVDVLWACCWLIGAEAWHAVGRFDEGYFMYYEDMDWCRRALDSGVVLRVVPEAILEHAVGGSFGGSRSAQRRYWMSRSGMRFARSQGVASIIVYLAATVRTVVTLAIARQPEAPRALVSGVMDGLRDPDNGAAADVAADHVPELQASDRRPTPSFDMIVASGHLPTTPASIRAILDQTAEKHISTIHVYGASGDGLPDDPRINQVSMAPGPACAAYNHGLRESRGTHVVFVDSDCLLSPEWLEQIIRRHNEGWHVVAGGVEVPEGPRLSVAYNLTSFHGFLVGRPTEARTWLPTMNLSVDRALARQVGAFREDLPRTYDVDWTLRLHQAGARLLFDGEARAAHHPCGVTIPLLWRTWFAGGSCSQAVRREHAGVITAPKWLARPVIILALTPVLTLAASARCVWRARADARIWRLLPIIFGTKLAWCLGAAHGSRHGPLTPDAYGYRAIGGAFATPRMKADDGGHDEVEIIER